MKWTKSYLTCLKNYVTVKSYIRMFCQEADVVDLYPEDTWELAQNNPNVNRDDRVFCGDEEVVYSFETWEEYIDYFMELVNGEEFLEFCEEEET